MKQTIYVKILDEGIDVWRPVLAEEEAKDRSYIILPTPINNVPSDEKWEFMSGAHVLTKEMIFDGVSVKVAFKAVC